MPWPTSTHLAFRPTFTPPSVAEAVAALEKLALTLPELRDAAKDTNTEPTEAQKESGRYKKGRVSWKGLVIAIENPKGSVRSGTSKDGTKWQTTTKDHYGYVQGTESEADGDAVDVFICEDHIDSEILFVINQTKPDGKFDEHKVVIGAISEEQAREVYLRNYAKGWKGLGSITAMTLGQFKEWLLHGDTSKKAADRTSRPIEASAIQGLDGYGATLPESTQQTLPQLRRERDHGVPPLGNELRSVPRGYGTKTAQDDVGAAKQQQRLQSEQLRLGDCSGTESQSAEHGAVDSRRTNATHARLGQRDGHKFATDSRANSPRRLVGSTGDSYTATAADNSKPVLKFAVGEDEPFTVAVDLDGTIAVQHKPYRADVIGEPRKTARRWLSAFRRAGARIIIFTVRGDTKQVEAWLKKHKLPYDHINTNPDQPEGSSGKVYAHCYWDDRAYNAERLMEFGPLILAKARLHAARKRKERHERK